MSLPPMSPPRALLLSVLLLLGACSGGDEPVEPLGPVDGPLVVIAVDGLRADRVGAYGASDGLTPNIDALASESLLFRWAFAQSPEALPSLASALTGLYPATSGVVGPEDHLTHEAVTLAESLSEAGYTTAAFVLGEETRSDHGLAQGFAHFVMSPEHAAKARAWLEKSSGERFLLLVAGWPGFPVAGDSESPDEEAYRAYLRAVDAGVGEIVARMRELGLDRSATLALLGTTGTSFEEHGEETGEGADLVLRPAAVRVPLMIRLPEGRRAGTVRRVVEVASLAPTLIELAGAERPGAAQAASLVPVVDGSAGPPYMAFGETPDDAGQGFAAEGGYQLLMSGDGESVVLYNLADDPLGTVDLASSQSQRAEALRSHLEAWSKMVAVASLDPDERSEEELDEGTLEQLRSLGYIQ